jgi:demethylmenaquinone methyltransferase/2-methoxy-6-polyprenyl-1,4-benzoquinol methylase
MHSGRDALMSADNNRRMFDAVARRYDFMNGILSLGLDRYWRRKAVRFLAPQAGDRILDIGCGTGDIAIEIIQQQPDVAVTGIDPAGEMLDRALKKITKGGFQDAFRVTPGDALALEFDDCFYDGVISAFCIRNVEDRLGAFFEMHRVLKPQKRAVVLELTKPDTLLIKAGHLMYNKGVVPLMGRFFSQKDAYRYLVESIEDFPSKQVISAKMRRAGFTVVKNIPLTGGIVTLFVGEK